MPEDGIYERVKITSSEASELINKATEIKSSVSYPDVVTVLKELSGVEIPLDTEKKLTQFEEDECIILICKLCFRVKSERKGVDRHLDLNEYEFFFCHFKKTIT